MIFAFVLTVFIGICILMIAWGIWRRFSNSEERKRTLAAYFGGWPPSRTNILLILVFYSALICLGTWLYEHRH